MVAILERSLDTRSTLLYNEEKVSEQRALFLGAYNFLQDAADLSFEDKLQRISDLTILNARARKTTLHFSINFHPNDLLSEKKMKEVASLFMQKAGFARQPYLIYRHFDAGHPHCHVVTTNVQPDGILVPNDKLSPGWRIKICAEIEQSHHLRHALDKIQPGPDHTPLCAEPLQYGQAPTKTSIASILNHTFEQFAYTSFEHWNALLSVYNVRADRGSEQGIMYKNKGLYYRMITKDGRKIGAPIKASAFGNRPILARLEHRFIENQARVRAIQRNAKNVIDMRLLGPAPATLQHFIDALAEKEVRVVISMPKPEKKNHATKKSALIERPAAPLINGTKEPCFFYVDMECMAVHRDKDLGPEYTLGAILKRSGLEETLLNLVKEGHLQVPRQQNIVPRHQDIALRHGNIALRHGDTGSSPASPEDPDKKLELLLGLTGQHIRWDIKVRQEQLLLRQEELNATQTQDGQKIAYRHRHSL